MATNPNDNAYPGAVASALLGERTPGFDGLTKREIFAMAALTGFVGNSEALSVMVQVAEGEGVETAYAVAACSVEVADALIDALNGERP